MKRIDVGALRESKIRSINKGKFRNKFIKCDTKGLEVIARLEENQERLTRPLYNLPDGIIYGSAKTPFAISTPYLYGYKTLRDCLFQKREFDKDRVAQNVTTIIQEYENLGMNYYDLHHDNFMIDRLGKFKVVDVDGADLHISPGLKMITINNLWDLLFEMYLYHFYPNYPLCLNSTLNYDELYEYFTKEFIEYLDGVIRDDKEILTVDPKIYLPELEDKDKIHTLSKKLEDRFNTYKLKK